MILSKVLEGVPVVKMFQTMFGKMVTTHDVEVRGIQYDSRKVGRGELFVAIRGTEHDGHAFIDHAVRRGAGVVVLEDDHALADSYFMHSGVVKVVVDDARRALAIMASNLYDHPSRAMRLIGVTGTNGKTTTTYLIKSILEAQGERVGLIGTIEHRIGSEKIAAIHTTPESLELNQLLAAMRDHGCSSVVMEVSSHALAMQRVHGMQFRVGTFTNLTQDHLDFHGSMEEYFRAKKTLFNSLGNDAWAVTNLDDGYGLRIVQDTRARKVTYGTAEGADLHLGDIALSTTGTTFRVEYRGATHRVESSLIGRFNVSNIAAAYATTAVLGVSEETIASGLAGVRSVRGRFERITSPAGWTVIIDYAHTPDALSNCLHTVRGLLAPGGRIVTVFGCGGDRDRGKRPLMGKIASELSDVTVVTSDNPRREDPHAILGEILAGVVPQAEVTSEVDRRKAIALALQSARPGDVVLIAGKGHETYQVLGETRVHFDDREEVESFIKKSPA